SYALKVMSFMTSNFLFFFSSRRRHTISKRDWSSDVCSSDLLYMIVKNYFKEQDLENADIDRHAKDFIELMDLQVISNTMFPSASVQVKKGNEVIKNSADGTGPIDALYSAILEVTDMDIN